MLNLSYPGVYTREVNSGVRTITGAPTSVALFVGPTRTGIDGRPVTCLSFADFERHFGGPYAKSSLSYSVMHFFANGGGQAVVIRLPAQNSQAAESTIRRDAAQDSTSLTVTALSSGSAGGSLFVEIDSFDIGAHPYSASPASDTTRFNLTIIDPVTGLVERFRDLTTRAGDARTVGTVVNDEATGSRLVKVTVAEDGVGKEGPRATGSVYRIGTEPTAGTFGQDITVKLSVTRRNPEDGTDDDGSSVRDLPVTVFRQNDARPASRLELLSRLVAALNEAIRADDAARRTLAGASIEGSLHENGGFLRLSVSRPTTVPGFERVHDATVEITGPAGGGSFMTEYGIETKVTNPSRYRLGHPYDEEAPAARSKEAKGGDSHGQPSSTDFKDAITALSRPDPFFNLLCLPDLVRAKPTDPKALQHTNAVTVYAEAARVCAEKFAFLIVDPPPDVVDIGTAVAWKSTKLGLRSDHAGAWFPNIRVDDPLQPGRIVSHPPSGAVAGVIARTDSQVGVWQAPAGTDAFLAGVHGLSVEVSDAEQGMVNPLGVNVIRRFPIYQTVAFGSRTVDGADALASEWKSIPVRRTASHILRSLSESLRWAVHQRNGEELWSQLRVNCTAFLHGLFRQGAFKGVSPREAYFVACDATTTTPADIDLGIVNIVIGFAPLKPAEFVVISLKQIVQPAL